MMQLVAGLSRWGAELHFATTAQRTTYSDQLDGIGIHSIELNSDSFDEFVRQLDPDLVVFDRFMTEEQFGWRVAEQCPNALRVLDTEDLHFLRQARQDGLDVDRPHEENLFSDKTKRELAAILRSDLSLIISEYEYQLLTEQFGISAEQLLYLPPWVNYQGPGGGFDQRKDLVIVGNLRHAPNLDAVSYFRNDLWPSIKSAIPGAEVRVYGAYAPENIRQLHSDREGFHIMGWTADIGVELARARLNICAVRFGAGLKIKLLDAMAMGTPSVSTQVGAEGIAGSMEFPGSIARDQKEFIEEVVRLYSREADWSASARACQALLESRYSEQEHHDRLLGRVTDLCSRVVEHRRRNFIIEVLQHQSLQSTKYLSKWITAKNRPFSE